MSKERMVILKYHDFATHNELMDIMIICYQCGFMRERERDKGRRKMGE